jgi:hypothetical protein
MDMRIGSSIAAASGQSSPISSSQQPQQNFANLFAALQAGNLGAAQNAYTALTGSGSTGNLNGNSPLAAIGQELQQDDLAGAQKAAHALQSGRSGHHHHHGGQSAASTGVSTSSSTSTPAAGATGSLINTTA